MAAKDALNKNLFVEVFHSSDSPTPPHLREADPRALHEYIHGSGNIHPDVIHAGTLESALDRNYQENRGNTSYLHKYKISKSSIHPVTYGDEQEQLDYPPTRFKEAMVGVPEGLWEDIPGDPADALKWHQAVPYRNRAEDSGSISYMLPKKGIKGVRGAKNPFIEYSGTTEIER